MDELQLWLTEERLWLEGASAFKEVLDDQCVMAFPAPVGLMRGSAIVGSLDGAPRWSRIAMAEQTVGRPDEGTVILAYRAEGERAGAASYRAYCTSTYRLVGGAWRLVQHQQTPIA